VLSASSTAASAAVSALTAGMMLSEFCSCMSSVSTTNESPGTGRQTCVSPAAAVVLDIASDVVAGASELDEHPASSRADAASAPKGPRRVCMMLLA